MGCTKGREIRKDVYEWDTYLKNDTPDRCYIVRDEKHARDLFSVFEIQEVGWFDNYYCGVAGHHWVILASNVQREPTLTLKEIEEVFDTAKKKEKIQQKLAGKNKDN